MDRPTYNDSTPDRTPCGDDHEIADLLREYNECKILNGKQISNRPVYDDSTPDRTPERHDYDDHEIADLLREYDECRILNGKQISNLPVYNDRTPDRTNCTPEEAERTILNCKFDLLRRHHPDVPSVDECATLTLDTYQRTYEDLSKSVLEKQEADSMERMTKFYDDVIPIINKLTLEKWETEGVFSKTKSLDELSLITEPEFEAETSKVYPEVMVFKLFNFNCMSMIYSMMNHIINRLKDDGHKYITDITDCSKYDDEIRILAHMFVIKLVDLSETRYPEIFTHPCVITFRDRYGAFETRSQSMCVIL
jgi:hypothetical protein